MLGTRGAKDLQSGTREHPPERKVLRFQLLLYDQWLSRQRAGWARVKERNEDEVWEDCARPSPPPPRQIGSGRARGVKRTLQIHPGETCFSGTEGVPCPSTEGGQR